MAIMPPTQEYVSPIESTPHSGIEFDLLDLLLVVAERKLTIILATLLGFFLALVLSLLTHPVFTAATIIMPPQQGQSSTALVSQLGGLASLTGLGTAGLKDPNDLYLALLQSNKVVDAVIKGLGLRDVYHTQKLSEARAKLIANSKFVSEKGGMISIAVTDADPHRAALIANTYVDELHVINSHFVIGEAEIRRGFFTQQLSLEKDRLTDAEIALKQLEETTGAVSPAGQTGVAIGQMAQLQSQVITREAQLDAMRSSSTDQNPDVIRLNSEIVSLRAQLNRLQGAESGRAPGNLLLNSRALAADQIEYMRKQRDVQYHTLIFDLIARQFEAARLDEAKAAPVIQVLDPAEPPDRKSGPYRALWCLIGSVLGLFFGCARVVGSYVYSRVNADDENAQRFGQFRRALSFRST